MKKLMIAALAAGMVGGAFAATGNFTYAAVYNIKYTLKTLTPKKMSCGDCTICTKEKAGYYYENGTVKIEGLLAYCSSCVKVGETYGDAILAIWDPTTKQPIFFEKAAWEDAVMVEDVISNSTNYALYVAPTNWFMTDATIYGKSSTKVALDTKIKYKNDTLKTWNGTVKEDYDLRAVGLGTYAWTDAYVTGDKAAGYVKSVSGNVAGRIPAYTGWDKTKKYYTDAQVLNQLCDGAAKYCVSNTKSGTYNTKWINSDYAIDEEIGVPAYGTWSMKFNSSATKKDISKSIPSYLFD